MACVRLQPFLLPSLPSSFPPLPSLNPFPPIPSPSPSLLFPFLVSSLLFFSFFLYFNLILFIYTPYFIPPTHTYIYTPVFLQKPEPPVQPGWYYPQLASPPTQITKNMMIYRLACGVISSLLSDDCSLYQVLQLVSFSAEITDMWHCAQLQRVL